MKRGAVFVGASEEQVAAVPAGDVDGLAYDPVTKRIFVSDEGGGVRHAGIAHRRRPGGRRRRTRHRYSIYELAIAAGVFTPTIERLETGESADKRVLSALAMALGVPLCQLVCGDHSCIERACVRAPSIHARQEN